ncbi:MAG: hypothetical protein JW761_01965 [Prolixibacteraceae bacterium]|nr:hypothetical protein [Prolixibacteraceae bacterium]
MRVITFFVFLLFFCISFLWGCISNSSQKIPEIDVIFPPSLDTVVFHSNESKSAVVYYFDGNCSVCYMTLKELEQTFKNIEIVGITPSFDTALILYQLELVNINATLLYDKDSLFYFKNKELMERTTIFAIDSNNRIDFIPTLH